MILLRVLSKDSGYQSGFGNIPITGSELVLNIQSTKLVIRSIQLSLPLYQLRRACYGIYCLQVFVVL